MAFVISERRDRPAASMSTKAFVVWLVIAGVFGFAVRFGTFMWEGRTAPLSGDAVFYHETANLLADGKGYVAYPNVDAVEEMVNMISASRSYQTNAEVMATTKSLMQRTLAVAAS